MKRLAGAYAIGAEESSDIHMGGVYSQGYGTVPKQVMVREDIPLAVKGLYAYLSSFTGGGNMECYPSIKRMAKECGCSVTTIRRYIAILEAEGLIVIRRTFDASGGTGVNHYVIVTGDVERDEERLQAIDDAAARRARRAAELRDGGGQTLMKWTPDSAQP